MAKHDRIFSRLWLLLLLTVFLVVASAAASAAKSSSADVTILQQQKGIRRTSALSLAHQLDNTLPIQQQNKERKLPGYYDVDISESFNRLFSTAPEAWTAGQWILVLFIILLTLWCCGCLAGGRRYHRGGYYHHRSSNGGMCGCLQNVLLCVCCYEWCCRDCHDVPCCNTGVAGGEYYRQTGDVV